uniref:Uncharacterized protein n=1 Tax=Yersinia enterocolitica TaxID=630 RepID=B0RKK2_YEREN|nr:hypothetical protein [Yersinia enterocolitica]CAP20112.1 hypothetical protein [Yersinia enterocolitica]
MAINRHAALAGYASAANDVTGPAARRRCRGCPISFARSVKFVAPNLTAPLLYPNQDAQQ